MVETSTCFERRYEEYSDEKVTKWHHQQKKLQGTIYGFQQYVSDHVMDTTGGTVSAYPFEVSKINPDCGRVYIF